MSIACCPKMYNQSLSDLCCWIQALDCTLTNCEIPEPNERIKIHHRIHWETNDNIYALDWFINENEPQLMNGQRKIYHNILNNMENDKEVTFFSNAPGGTDLINLLLAKVYREKNITLAVESTGIAAILLDGGKTAHSMFCLPLHFTHQEKSFYNIKNNSSKCLLLQICKLLMKQPWAPNKQSNLRLDSVEFKSQNKSNRKSDFGLCWSLQSNPSNSHQRTRTDQIIASLNKFNLWHHIQKLYLRINMQVHLNIGYAVSEFATKVLRVGTGLP